MLGGEALLSAVWTLLVVLAVCVLAYWFTRRVALSGFLGGVGSVGGSGRLRVLAQLSVGRDERLVVAAVGARRLLLGVTPAGITLLAELSEEEAADWNREEAPARPSFREALRANIKRKNG